jgi:hypothetical protein
MKKHMWLWIIGGLVLLYIVYTNYGGGLAAGTSATGN